MHDADICWVDDLPRLLSRNHVQLQLSGDTETHIHNRLKQHDNSSHNVQLHVQYVMMCDMTLQHLLTVLHLRMQHFLHVYFPHYLDDTDMAGLK